MTNAQRKPPKVPHGPPPPSGYPNDTAAKTDDAEAGAAVVEKLLAGFEANPQAKAAFLKSVYEGLGLGPAIIALAGVTYAPDLSDRPALIARARKVIEKVLNAHSIAVHRDAIYYLAEAVAEEFYVAPPVKPEDVQGVG